MKTIKQDFILHKIISIILLTLSILFILFGISSVLFTIIKQLQLQIKNYGVLINCIIIPDISLYGLFGIPAIVIGILILIYYHFTK